MVRVLMLGNGRFEGTLMGRVTVRWCACVIAMAWFFASPTHGQSVSGKWVGTWRVLDDGETDRMYLDLQQTGTQISGTMTTIGHIFPVTGTLTGSHFELFTSPRDTKPRVTGDVAGHELHLSRENAQFAAVPATPDENYPKFERLPLPALHTVEANSLAKTPPMGWNSWNLFENRIDDKTVREMADAMVTSGMRDAGYVYVNIDDTWEGVRDAQ